MNETIELLIKHFLKQGYSLSVEDISDGIPIDFESLEEIKDWCEHRTGFFLDVHSQEDEEEVKVGEMCLNSDDSTPIECYTSSLDREVGAAFRASFLSMNKRYLEEYGDQS